VNRRSNIYFIFLKARGLLIASAFPAPHGAVEVDDEVAQAVEVDDEVAQAVEVDDEVAQAGEVDDSQSDLHTEDYASRPEFGRTCSLFIELELNNVVG